MFGQIPLYTILLFMLYGAVTIMALIACLYLLLRRGNAFVPDVTPPMRLRQWTAAFFAIMALGHLWYLPSVVFTSSDNILLFNLIGGLLDCMLTIPLALIVMLCMLQDRQRPLWPVGVMVAPLVAGVVVCIVTRSEVLMPWLRCYFMLAAVGFTIYMVREVRRYGRWLRDNYADLEHKEVWQSFLVLAAIMLMFGYYVGGYGGIIYEYIVQVFGLFLICYLLWRVETLSDLSISQPLSIPVVEEIATTGKIEDDAVYQSSDVEHHLSEDLSEATSDKIGSLLQQHCIDTQLYLQHDLTVSQLAQAIGTNRTYLSQYFSRQGTTYNAYINNLRINHFVSLYREAIAAQRSFTVQRLASESGYRSYSTFSLAFKQRMGQSVTAWMRDITN